MLAQKVILPGKNFCTKDEVNMNFHFFFELTEYFQIVYAFFVKTSKLFIQ